eukprot:TRINITY_DN26628_c0_g1_i1.p1 TRINITY_DN26628_c0_g1~~TRINITY_DN26628_c0_g1_i1.p1  ORF type:complete len:512 (-),score=96.93 TRINITY_DN26628_c0_g1_i1:45-1526(-)
MWGYSVVGCVLMLYYLYLSIPEANGSINSLKQYKTIRALDGNEELYAKVETDLGCTSQTYAIIIQGPLTITILRKALQQLQKQYQVLRLGIHFTNGTFYFHEYFHGEDLINLQVFEREDDFHWQKLMKIEGDRYRTVITEDKLLWKIIFLENKENPSGPHELILSCMHVIFDGTSRMTFTNALLTICGDMMDGKDDDVGSRKEISFFKGPRELLFGNGNNSELLDWKAKYLPDPIKTIAYNIQQTFKPKINSGQPIPFSIKPPISRSSCFKASKMSNAFTRKFSLICKQNSVTFHSGLCAAISIAAQKTWNLKELDSLKFIIPVRLREKCKPRVENDQICFCIGTKDMSLQLNKLNSETLWKYAQCINNHLHNKESDKEMINVEYAAKYYSKAFGILSPLVMKDSTESGSRVAHFSISNLGVLPYSTQFGKQLHLDGWFAMTKDRYVGGGIYLSLSTLDYECCLTTSWTDGVMNSEQVMDFHKEFTNFRRFSW